MKSRDIHEARNPDLAGAVAAIQRAAEDARRIAMQTGTGIVIEQNGVIKHVSADELRDLERSHRVAGEIGSGMTDTGAKAGTV